MLFGCLYVPPTNCDCGRPIERHGLMTLMHVVIRCSVIIPTTCGLQRGSKQIIGTFWWPAYRVNVLISHCFGCIGVLLSVRL